MFLHLFLKSPTRWWWWNIIFTSSSLTVWGVWASMLQHKLRNLILYTEHKNKCVLLFCPFAYCRILRYQHLSDVFMILWFKVNMMYSTCARQSSADRCDHQNKNVFRKKKKKWMWWCCLCMRKLLPHSDMNAFLGLKVRVVCVVQTLIQRLLKINKIRHSHWGKQRDITCIMWCLAHFLTAF